MDLIQCADCEAMVRPDARYCSNCARNVVAERLLVRRMVFAALLLACLVAASALVYSFVK